MTHPWQSRGLLEWKWAAYQSMSTSPVKRCMSVVAVRELLDTLKMAGGNFLPARTEGSGTLRNICQSCASGFLSCKAGTIYGSCNRDLGGVPYNFHLDISKQWGFSQHGRSCG